MFGRRTGQDKLFLDELRALVLICVCVNQKQPVPHRVRFCVYPIDGET